MVAFALPPISVSDAQELVDDPIIQTNFRDIREIGSGIGSVTQMTFGPDGKLYVATYTQGIKRFDYDPEGNLTNGVTVWSRAHNPQDNGQFNGSLGIAFHVDPVLGNVMYIAPAVSGSFNVEKNLTQSLVRLTDDDGDGKWGETGEVNQAIVDNLRVTDLHQVNQLLVQDDTLYAGIGSRTRSGGDQNEYPGDPNPDDGEFAYTGAINWIRDLTQLSGDTTTPNLAGFDITSHHTETRPFTSTDTGKLTVYSTGFRNVYGIGFDQEGQLWATMNQNETPLKPDELHRSDFQDDHSFPKENEVSGDWKTNPDAIGAGFFQTFEEPVSLLGNHASANGIDFTDINDAFAGQAFIVRYAAGDDLIAVDPDTGQIRQVATGFSNPLEVATDPNGQLLVGTHGAGGQIFRIRLFDGTGVVPGDINGDGLVNVEDWSILRENFNADLTGLTISEAYALGDLNGDFQNNRLDFSIFKSAFEEANGEGAFARLGQVPEPATWILACMFALSLPMLRHAGRGESSPRPESHTLRMPSDR